MLFHLLLTLTSVVLFSFCARAWISSLRAPTVVDLKGIYSRQALRIRKMYLIFAWGAMTLVFLGAVIGSWIQVWTLESI